ncbi:molybdenum cofactor biosynthesis protein MoaE [Nocardioides terrisoli]|uniref:molybdenum cofactor biosynthesis protein MoaE n=1 Tax=Nocardioides terrisoli TaxID=3388267 RepID=UPI00287B5FFC|nr:molybdenum cofactor biosynthesis protein MoaE [Nocardioides marmorisolisilvae]
MSDTPTSATTPSDPTRVRLVDLRTDPLDPAEVLAAVSDPAAGGLNLFVGTVRDSDHGAGVDHLDYSAHPGAAERLGEVAASVAAAHDDVVAVAAVHRVGKLVVGDLAVVVAVSAGHRDQAYVASRTLIDRLKSEVPVWKHQVFTDGTDEWVAHA